MENPFSDIFCCSTSVDVSISFSGTQYLDRIDGVIDCTFSENFTEADAGNYLTGRNFCDVRLCWL